MAEQARLRIVLLTELRRTFIRETHRIGMRHKDVQPANQHMVRQVLHHFQALRPAVGAENLAKRLPVLARLRPRSGCGQLCQPKVEEIRVGDVIPAGTHVGVIRHARDDLVQHDVDPRHVLPGQRAEIVSAAAHVGVLPCVLHDVADGFDPVCAAPIAQPFAEILLEQPADNFHVGGAAGRRNPGHRKPERREPGSPVCPDCFGKRRLNEAVPRIAAVGIGFPAGWKRRTVHDVRFIAEKTAERMSEIGAQMLRMRLVDLFYQQ